LPYRIAKKGFEDMALRAFEISEPILSARAGFFSK
jgi:hypothetical protein